MDLRLKASREVIKDYMRLLARSLSCRLTAGGKTRAATRLLALRLLSSNAEP